jgi:hypothetical protein
MKKINRSKMKNDYCVCFFDKKTTETIYIEWFTTKTKKDAIKKAKRSLLKSLAILVETAPSGDMD